MENREFQILLVFILSITVAQISALEHGIDGTVTKIYMSMMGLPLGYIAKSFLIRRKNGNNKKR